MLTVCNYISMKNVINFVKSVQVLHVKLLNQLNVVSLNLIISIPEFLDSGHKIWTLDSGLWMLNPGLVTLDLGR